MDILDKIIFEDKTGNKFYDIRNDKQKRWLLNQNNIKQALEIYQPTSLKGILFRSIFPFLSSARFITNLLNVSQVRISINNDVLTFLNDVFIESYDISLFSGTPSIHQKAILQISQNNVITAYCKISCSEATANLFQKEIDMLQHLRSRGIDNIPYVIKYDKINEMYFFCQSNVKTKKYKTVNELHFYHYDFLIKLHDRTKRKILFNKTDYAVMLEELQCNLHKMNIKDRELICNYINHLNRVYHKTEVDFSVYHGDFTPWNMVVINQKLNLFDFEYSKKTYPPYLDIFHFLLQTEFFVNHNSVSVIMDKYDKLKKELEKLNIDPSFYFKLYLLEVINLYLSRTNELTDEEKIYCELRIYIFKLL